MNGIAQLVEIIEMVLPFLVQHVEHNERQETVAVTSARLGVFRLIEAGQLVPECLPGRVARGLLRVLEGRGT